jgi:tetratricopeptide (TPR) repeat protein
MRKKATYLFYALLMSGLMHNLFSQNPLLDLDNAQRCFNEYGKNKANQTILDSARIYIDRAVEDPDIAISGMAFNFRGAIYKELYKAREAGNFNSNFREKSVEYFLRSYELDTTLKNRDIVKQQIKWLAIQYNNDAKKILEKDLNMDAAEKSFMNFKKLILIYDSNFNIKSKEIEFQLACGSALQDKAQSLEKKEFYDLAKVSYFRVLDMDSTNKDANYNIGIIYYNQGANLIMKVLDFDTPIDSIPIFEDMAKKYFTQAKPFMLKASKSPNCMKVIEGLMGIYYSLNDEENYQKIKERFDKIKSEIEAGLIKEEC